MALGFVNVFDTLAAWLGYVKGRDGQQVLQPTTREFTNPVDSFLFDMSAWHPVNSSHHDAVIYDAGRQEMHVKFPPGKGSHEVCIVSNISRDEALSYYHAPSKGKWYWRVVRVAGKGNGHKTRKPFRYA